MVCRTIPNEGGFAIVCGPRRPRRRCACGNWATKECDFPAPRRKSKTCDKPLCDRCAVRVGPDKDECPGHDMSRT